MAALGRRVVEFVISGCSKVPVHARKALSFILRATWPNATAEGGHPAGRSSLMNRQLSKDSEPARHFFFIERYS
jgi:hypothetical protein